jgi:parallel beta-helix repeat protein
MKSNCILILLITFLIASGVGAQVNQDLFLYEKKRKFEVRGKVNGKVLIKEADASGAINSAIEILAAQNGGELEISSGTYIIHSPVSLRSNIRLEGSGKGTVLKMGERNEKEILIEAKQVEEIIISEMHLQGIPGKKKSIGIVFDHVGMGTIDGIYARDFGQYGIWLKNDCFMCEVNSCQTAGNDSAGVYLSWNNWSGRGGNAVPNLITNCKSYGEDGHAFELMRSTCNNLVGNIVYQCKGHGFYFHEHSCSNLISGCRVFSGFQNAIYCNRAHEINISSNIFCWNRGHGIEIENTIWGTIAGNNVIDNGDVVDYEKGEWKTGKRYGIYLHGDTRSLQVSSNAIFNWPDGHPPMIDGIYEAEECQNNNISNNNVQFYTGLPANVNGKNSISINNAGDPDFYTEPWVGPFQPEEDKPTQVLLPLSRDVVDKMLEKTRR